MVAALKTRFPFGAGIDRRRCTPSFCGRPLLKTGPRATTSRPGDPPARRGAPSRPGPGWRRRSSCRCRRRASGCSLTQVQSAPPLAGSVVRAPISVAGSGPCCFHLPAKRVQRGCAASPNLPTRAMTRCGWPWAFGQSGTTPSTELPLKNAALTPASMRRLHVVEHLQRPVLVVADGQQRLGPQQARGVGVGVDVADVGDVVAVLLHPEGERELPEQEFAGALRERGVENLAVLAVGPVAAQRARPGRCTSRAVGCRRRRATK